MKKKSYDILKNQKEIAESFKYASYIQNALLPSQSLIKKYIPEFFLLFLPRDIVELNPPLRGIAYSKIEYFAIFQIITNYKF